MIELKDGRYFIGVWFISDEQRDTLGTVFRDKGSAKWELRYRIREHHPDSGPDPFNDKDTKKSWRATSLETEDEVFQKTNQAFAAIAALTGMDFDYLDLRTDDGNAIIRELETRPWVHTKQLTMEEAKREGWIDK